MAEPTAKDLKWMKFCFHGAKLFSTCSRKQYFSIIIDGHGHVLATGVNGVPSGFVHCDQGGCPRATAVTTHGSSYHDCYAIHSEVNALLHSDYTARSGGVTLYVNGPPCFDCAKLIANSNVKRLVYVPDEEYPDWERIEGFLETANITLVALSKDYL